MTYIPPGGSSESPIVVKNVTTSSLVLSPYVTSIQNFGGGMYDIIVSMVTNRSSNNAQRLPAARLLVDNIFVGLSVDPNFLDAPNFNALYRQVYTFTADRNLTAGPHLIVLQAGSGGSQPILVYGAKVEFKKR